MSALATDLARSRPTEAPLLSDPVDRLGVLAGLTGALLGVSGSAEAGMEAARAALAEEKARREQERADSANQSGLQALVALTTADDPNSSSSSGDHDSRTSTAPAEPTTSQKPKDPPPPKDPLEGKHFGSRRRRKKKFRSRIPWELLDNLDAQKRAMEEVGKAQHQRRSDSVQKQTGFGNY